MSCSTAWEDEYGAQKMNERLVRWVASERVDIATPYFLPDDDLIESMGPAVDRGVRVRLLLPSRHNDATAVRLASLARYPALLDCGLELYEYERTMLHTKTVSIDGRWSIVGSANFDKRSFELNNEVLLVVDDASFARELDASFERDLEQARRIGRREVLARPLSQRVASRLALTLRPYL